MNTRRNVCTVHECPECGDAFMLAGDTPIRLAFPRPVIDQSKGKQKVCPKHAN